ncbi:MAG: putative lipid II flippase FtsW [Gammaproteobacteria bacterium]
MTARSDSSVVGQPLFLAWLAALAIGLVMVTSASMPLGAELYHRPFQFTNRHLVYIGLASLAFALVVSLHYKLYARLDRLANFATIVGLLMVLVVGDDPVKGSRRWIDLGVFSLQPSELAKVAFLLYIAGQVTRRGEALRSRFGALMRPVLVTSLLGVLLLLEPDFGTMVVLALVSFSLMFLAGARLTHLALIALLGGAAVVLVLTLEPYRLARLTAFLNPWAQPFGGGYQLTQSLIAFGRGEWFGLGLGQSIQKLFYLPEAHTDFIFAVMAEELGLVGVAAVAGLLSYITLYAARVGRTSLRCGQVFRGFVAYGAGLLLGVQFLVNVGVNVGLLPTKGLTLPLISYGGNSLIVCSMLVGFIVRADFENREEGAP